MPIPIQILRSFTAGSRPAGRQPGELYVNLADNVVGYIDEFGQPQDIQTGGGGSVDLAADYPWTGNHTWNGQLSIDTYPVGPGYPAFQFVTATGNLTGFDGGMMYSPTSRNLRIGLNNPTGSGLFTHTGLSIVDNNNPTGGQIVFSIANSTVGLFLRSDISEITNINTIITSRLGDSRYALAIDFTAAVDSMTAYLENLDQRLTEVESSVAGLLKFSAVINDDSENITPPSAYQFQVTSVAGTGVNIVNGGLTFDTTDQVVIEWRGYIKQGWGNTVTFFYQWDDEGLIQLGTVTINSDDFLFAWKRATITQNVGKTLTFWVSTDFEFNTVSWRDVEIIGTTVQTWTLSPVV